MNGDFEAGDFTGWEGHYGKVYLAIIKLTGKVVRKVDYNKTADGQPGPVIADSSTVLPTQNAPVVPFGGVKMARINDLDGGQHVTCLHQTIILPPDFSSDCAFVSFDWAAMLGGSGHPDISRPKFSFVLNRKRNQKWKTFLKQDFIAPESNGDGWSDIRKAGAIEAVWYKSGSEKMSLAGLLPGDELRLRFVAEDCSEGAHGGAAFVDNVIVTNGCDSAGATNQPISFDALANVFTPNGDGANDVWGINNLQGACRVEFTVWDRWGDQVFYHQENSFDGSWPNFLGIWSGTIRTRRRKKGIGKRKRYYTRMISNKDMEDGVAFYVLKASNCYETREEPGFVHIFT